MKHILYEKQFFEMSNLTPEDTGLPFIIWISPKSGKEGHWARIKVEYNNKLYSMSIDDNPEWKIKDHIKIPVPIKQTKKIIDFVKQNKNILLDYWNSKGNMSMGFVLKNIKKL